MERTVLITLQDMLEHLLMTSAGFLILAGALIMVYCFVTEGGV